MGLTLKPIEMCLIISTNCKKKHKAFGMMYALPKK